MSFLREKYRQIKSAKRIVKFVYWQILELAYKTNILSIKDIPVIINNFNRLTYPLQLLRFLDGCGFTNIIILDNNSTYPPLLKFYEDCSYKVIRSDKNHGHLSLWRSGLYRKYKWNYFIYTDPDVVPIEECPADFIKYFKSILFSNYHIDKVGFGIKIDDLPASFSSRERIIAYEKVYWENEIAPNVYGAPIDTTFALYRPLSNLKFGEIYTIPAVRFGFPYLIRHMPWYVDSENLSTEEVYYIRTSNSSSSIGELLKGNENMY